jgi:hypothetical protein
VGEVDTVAKKALGPMIVIFALFFLLTRPENAAGAVEVMGEAISDALNQIARFFTALLS